MWGIEGIYKRNLDFLGVCEGDNFSFKSYTMLKIFREFEGDFGRFGGGGGYVRQV